MTFEDFWTILWERSSVVTNDDKEDFESCWKMAERTMRAPMPCGHPKACIVSSDEGTSHCGACEREARAVTAACERLEHDIIVQLREG